ncbi:hypothetical protein GGH94_005791 [Coemansia aciculifera]|uniref:Uncharacterized protein n=1 Tax=Coemansia aciculifera TaxID=417176 RepID=A0A9W8ICW3_9FUNG|nr:hypothetical protein GGH94_005791 [Coemansia aciculifera]
MNPNQLRLLLGILLELPLMPHDRQKITRLHSLQLLLRTTSTRADPSQVNRSTFNKWPKTLLSALGLVSGSTLSVDESLVKIMANIPFMGNFCTYAVPMDILPEEFTKAANNVCLTEPMPHINWPHVQVSPSQGVAGIGVATAEELVVLKEAQILRSQWHPSELPHSKAASSIHMECS